jgi:hypothetical protein
MIFFAGAPERTEPLKHIIRVWTLVLGIDFLISFSYTLWPRKSR